MTLRARIGYDTHNARRTTANGQEGIDMGDFFPVLLGSLLYGIGLDGRERRPLLRGGQIPAGEADWR